MKTILVFAMTILILTACASGPTPNLTGEWKLVSYGDAANPTPAVPDVDTTIQFKNGQMNGNVGCNSFGGEYTLTGNTLTFGAILSTLMYCDSTSPQEQAILGIFAEGAELTLSMNSDILTITSPDGASVVNLARK